MLNFKAIDKERQEVEMGNRIMIAATGSGSGKTMITCGILNCLKRRGLKVGAWKCGPDYIDPMFHSRILGVSTRNLDSFFCDKDTIQYLVEKREMQEDISVIEGVMGYFDGIGFTETGSSAEIAEWTKTPVILVVNGAGMSRSIGAVLKGFQEMEKTKQIMGVIFNRISKNVYKGMAEMARNLGIIPIGYVPKLKEIQLPSRHLGLVTAQEITSFQSQFDLLSDQLEQTLDWEQLLKLAAEAGTFDRKEELNDITVFRKENPEAVTVAVARDEAFCFFYPENIELLEQLGCNVCFFSPLQSQELPKHADALYLGGGYPELHAKQLAENKKIRNDILNAIQNGMPCIAECGGFLYLHRELEDEQYQFYPMVPLYEGKGLSGDRLGRFGYITMRAEKDGLLAKKGDCLYAHEFHYWNSEAPGSDFYVRKPGNGREWMSSYHTDTLYAGFPHLYLYGNRKAAMSFVKAAQKFQKRKVNGK